MKKKPVKDYSTNGNYLVSEEKMFFLPQANSNWNGLSFTIRSFVSKIPVTHEVH